MSPCKCGIEPPGFISHGVLNIMPLSRLGAPRYSLLVYIFLVVVSALIFIALRFNSRTKEEECSFTVGLVTSCQLMEN